MSASKKPPEASMSGFLKHKSRILGLSQTRHYWLFGNTLKISKSSSLEEVYKEMIITPTTNIILKEDKHSPEITIDFVDGPYVLIGSLKEILPWFCALRDCKSTEPKQLSMDSFRVVSVLGHGFFGKVLLVEKTDNRELYALKTIRKKKLIEMDQVSTVQAERTLLFSIPNHPFIINLCFAFQTQYKFYLGLEYAAGGELLNYLNQFPVIPIDDTRLYIAEITLALEHLYKHDIIYRDLKPENILLDKTGHIKLTDFGLSKNVGETDGIAKTFCGTDEYLAPEVVRHVEYDHKVDIWSLGVVLYEIMFGETPFYDENQSAMFDRILSKEPEFPKFGHVPAMELIKLLLSKNPADRPSFEMIKANPFFRGLKWDLVFQKKIKPAHFKDNYLDNNEGEDEPPVDSEVNSKEVFNLELSNFSFGFSDKENQNSDM